MRILLDEMLPRRLASIFAPEIEAVTVRQRGWGEKTNGELIEAAHEEFDALVTMDRGIPHQQNLADVDLAVVLLEAQMDEAKTALSEAHSGEVDHVTAS